MTVFIFFFNILIVDKTYIMADAFDLQGVPIGRPSPESKVVF